MIPNENWHWCRGLSASECGFGDDAMDGVVLVFRERELMALRFDVEYFHVRFLSAAV